ncbi:MAG TPA: arsenite methyltransferase [Bacteroides sp.]|nr:arsenite methyltransferase [Bacteroides sp.]
MKAEDLKLIVQDKYAEIASKSQSGNRSSCCGAEGCCDETDYSMLSEDYTALEGYNPEADLGLGCGLPTAFAGIKKGDHVLDLGSGAGNDCFVARTLVGEEGRVTGLDFTDAMLEKAERNLEKTGFTNLAFVKGDIEKMPLPDNTYDVVISNCVLNLVPDKRKAFGEIYRVLKPGGHFCISDVVLEGALPEKIREAAEMYAGCVSGALQKQEYLAIIREAGFTGMVIHAERKTDIPDDMLGKYLSPDEIESFTQGDSGVFSITLNAEKPGSSSLKSA